MTTVLPVLFKYCYKYCYSDSRNERGGGGRGGALQSDSTHHFFRNACTKSGSLRFSVFRLLTDFVCLYTYEFLLSLCKIARSSVILLLPLFDDYFVIEQTPTDVLCVIDGHSSKPRWSKSIILRSERCYSTNYNTGSCRDNSVITLF